MVICTYVFLNIIQTDFFLKVPIEEKSVNESKKTKLLCLQKLTQTGRDMTGNQWSKILPIFASFCTKKEEESANNYRNAGNLSATVSKNNYESIFKELRGKSLTDILSSAKFAFIVTIIHNNLIKENTSLTWKPMDTAKLRFTGPKQRGGTGGWAQEGFDFYLEKYQDESKYRKAMLKQHKTIVDRPDYFANANEEENSSVGTNEHQAQVDEDSKDNQEDYEIYSEAEEDDGSMTEEQSPPLL